MNDFVAAIESLQFDAEMNIFSGFQSFVDAAREHPAYLSMLTALDSPATAEQVKTRLNALLPCDPQFANPKDASIAIYLLGLWDTGYNIVDLAKVMSKDRNLFWSQKIARDIVYENELDHNDD